MNSVRFTRGASLAGLAATMMLVCSGGAPASAATVDSIRSAGKIVLGYRVDAPPFSFQDASGKPAGFSIALCEKVAAEVGTALNLPNLNVEWTPVTVDDRFSALTQSKIDLLCGSATETLSRRADVSFSIGIFPSGIGALVRANAPAALVDVLSGREPTGPIWRGSPARVLQAQRFSVVKATRSDDWLKERIDTFELPSQVVQVDDYDAGIRKLLDGEVDVFFGERSILLDAAARNSAASNLLVLDRLFTHEPVALALQRNDDDFRLMVDRALSHEFLSGEGFRDLLVKWFGVPDEGTTAFYRMSAIPD